MSPLPNGRTMHNNIGVVWCGSLPRSLTCSEVKHRPVLLVPGRLTTRVFSYKSSPRIDTCSKPYSKIKNRLKITFRL